MKKYFLFVVIGLLLPLMMTASAAAFVHGPGSLLPARHAVLDEPAPPPEPAPEPAPEPGPEPAPEPAPEPGQ